MPLAHPSHVVSFSSEDPHHPASNLLNRETFRKWKCKQCGEKEAFVILKFDKAQEINCVDIGNDGSALVEVSVARSGNGGEPQFEVLLSSTAFMSPLDSREGKNLNGVKNFSAHSLSKPIASQKWDLVKVQVSQPFNRHVQYGLTFIKFVVAPDPNEPQKIGLFGFRKPIGGGDDSDDDDGLRPGSLFSRKFASTKKDPAIISSPKPSSSLSTNAVIQEASKKLANASKSANDDEVKSLLRKPKSDLPSPSPSPVGSKGASSGNNNSPLIKRKQPPDALIKSKDKSNIGQNNPTSSSSPKTSNDTSKKRTLSPDPQTRGSTNSPSTSKNSGTPAKKPKKARKTKPFNKLLDGVVFSLSGFENPLRGQLRDKATQMGGRYKADWDRTCTHLLCAFYNTPKFRQVKGEGIGKIVKKDWIEKCFADRCRHPWRRYCLDKKDQGSESEEDIYAEQNDEEELLDDDTEAEQLTNNNDDLNSKAKRKRAFVLESSDEDEKSDVSKKAYDADTDIDEDKTPDLSPSLMDDIPSGDSQLFQGITFCLNLNETSSDSQDSSGVESIIIKHKGKIHETLKDSTEYFVCQSFEWMDEFADALSDNPNLIFVHKNWILECDKEDALIEKDSFMLSPS